MPELRHFRIVFRPVAHCEECGWSRGAGRDTRNDAKRHARYNPGHEVIVEVADRTSYVMPKEPEPQ
jgi:hypothetical protein